MRKIILKSKIEQSFDTIREEFAGVEEERDNDQRPIECFMPGVEESAVDNSMEHFLQEIVDTTEYNAFYCGHWHTEKQDGKLRILFHDVIMLE